jgi:PAS domain-containing protein
VLFPVVNLALGLELLRTGLADIVPYATQQAFNAISDAAIALDRDGAIVALNTAAQDLFPAVELGATLSDVDTDLARTSDACLSSAASYAGFDLERDERVYWGRVRPTRDARGTLMGCIVLLTDVTEVRMTQSKLMQLGVEPGV